MCKCICAVPPYQKSAAFRAGKRRWYLGLLQGFDRCVQAAQGSSLPIMAARSVPRRGCEPCRTGQCPAGTAASRSSSPCSRPASCTPQRSRRGSNRSAPPARAAGRVRASFRGLGGSFSASCCGTSQRQWAARHQRSRAAAGCPPAPRSGAAGWRRAGHGQCCSARRCQ